MSESNWDHDEYKSKPFRLSMEELQKQKQEILKSRDLEKKSNPKTKTVFNAVSMYGVAVDFALLIAIPLIVFILLGKWADQKFGKNYFIVIGLLTAIAISTLAIYKQINKLSKYIKKK